jgi:hypothetical protein
MAESQTEPTACRGIEANRREKNIHELAGMSFAISSIPKMEEWASRNVIETKGVENRV